MFLDEPEFGDDAQELFARDEQVMGWIMNVTKLWSYQPESQRTLFALMGSVTEGLSMRERGILVTACASTIDDSYCSLSWGGKLAKESDGDTAAGVLIGTDNGLNPREQALASWARSVAGDANATRQADVDNLRSAGFSDDEIFAITVFVGLRIAFSTVNGALGASPDAELCDYSPGEVLDAVDFGRPISPER